MSRRYLIYDVFTDRPLSGNALAVVLDSDGLDAAAMQAIAREFHLSETVFVLPPDNPAHSARLRIFTPAAELPFAGHPTVGAAIALTAERFGPGEAEQDAVLVLEEEIGAVRCGARVRGAAGFAEFDLPKLPELAGLPAEKETLAAALALAPAAIGFENHVPSLWSAGVPFHFVPVRDRAALSEARPVRQAWGALGGHGAYLYTRDAQGHDHAFRARMFAPDLGIDEDPATGAAAAAFAGAVHHFDAPPDGVHAIPIEPGHDMGRPSLIRLEIHVEAGSIVGGRIGGDAVRVAQGRLDL